MSCSMDRSTAASPTPPLPCRRWTATGTGCWGALSWRGCSGTRIQPTSIGTSGDSSRGGRAASIPPRPPYLLAYLDAELAHAGAGWSGADPELLREALASGIPSSAPSQAVLERYQAAYLAAGLTFPGGLLMEGDPAAPAPP